MSHPQPWAPAVPCQPPPPLPALYQALRHHRARCHPARSGLSEQPPVSVPWSRTAALAKNSHHGALNQKRKFSEWLEVQPSFLEGQLFFRTGVVLVAGTRLWACSRVLRARICLRDPGGHSEDGQAGGSKASGLRSSWGARPMPVWLGFCCLETSPHLAVGREGEPRASQ